MKEPKILEQGESTYRNGGDGAMCGGVISQSTFNSNPWAYIMAYVMPDDKFELYKMEKDEKKRKELFKRFSKSMI